MPRTNKTLTNFVGGELSPLMFGRIDLPVFQKGLARCENFIALAQGGSKFRPGTTFVKHTRKNRNAILIPFQYSDQQAYLLEASDRKFRFYKDDGIILETPLNITGITRSNPVVVTAPAHGFSNGDEVFIDGVTGMTELNEKYFTVGEVTTNTFTLFDEHGHNAAPLGLLLALTSTRVDSTTYTPYGGGGTVARVYEIDTPFLDIDLPFLQFTQNADTMYITQNRYAPRKVTRSGHTAWALNVQTRTNNPASLTPTTKNISGVTNANPGVVTTSTAHGLTTGQEIYIDSIVGMTALNGQFYTVKVLTTTTFSLVTSPEGIDVDTTTWAAYTSGGTITVTDKFPRACSFTDSGRLVLAATLADPETMWFSSAPSTGTTAFDNFLNGTAATNGITATLTPIHGKVDSIQWLAFTSKFLVAGTYGSIRRVYGSTEETAVSVTDFNAKSVNSFGCALTLPVSNGESLFYIQRGSYLLRSLEYDITIDGYDTVDRNLVADAITKSGIRQICEQQGKPDIVWGSRYDGRYIGLTFKEKEDISGWHRHYLSGEHRNTQGIVQKYGKVLWVARMPRPSMTDQLWFVVEREMNGQTYRTVEYMNDWVTYSDFRDFYTGEDNYDSDREQWINALYEDQKDAIYLDCSLTYDGTTYGTNGNTYLTPGAGATGVNVGGQPMGMALALTYPYVTFLSSTPVFTASMVGRELRKQYDVNGDGGGRARIVEYISPLEVRTQILSVFNNLEPIAPGRWFLTASTISGLDHLEGQTVGVIQDGGPGNDAVVTNGTITLDAQYSKVHVGFKYRGMIETLNLDSGGVTGSAQAKNRNLIGAAFRFLESLGSKFGTDPYKLEQLSFRSTADKLSRPTPIFTGLKEQTYFDSWEQDIKRLVVIQDLPLPCTILSIDCFMDTTDE